MIDKWYRYFRAHFRATLRLSLPVIIGQLGFVLMGVTDTLMIGRVGEVYLSAAALANGVYLILTILGMGITFAIAPLVSEANGAGEPEKAGDFLKQGTWVTLAASLFIAVLCWISADFLGHPSLNQPVADVPFAKSYLQIISFSGIPMLIFLVFKSYSDGMLNTRPAMIITLIALGMNVALNGLLIYGWLGFPALKLDGAAIATAFSRIFMMVAMVVYVLGNKRFAVNRLTSGWWTLKPALMQKILSIGVPSGIQYFFEIGAFMGGMVMIGWLGTSPRAAHQAVMTLASVTYMVVSGLAAGGSIRVADFLGKKSFRDLKMAGVSAIILTVVFMALTSVLLLLGRYAIPGLFVKEQEVIDIAARLMIIAAVFQIFDGVQAVGIANLRGIQDVWIPTLIAFVSYWIVALPVGYIFGFSLHQGVVGVWYGYIAGLALASVLLTSRFIVLSNRWIGSSVTETVPTSMQKELDVIG